MKDERNVGKMIEYIDKVCGYCAGKTYDEFVADEMLVEACVFNLSQLGEVSHRLSDELVELHPEIAWRELYGLRNRLVHDYEGTNPKLVWEIITEDLSELRRQVEGLA